MQLDRRGKFTFEEFKYFLKQIGVQHTDTRSIIDLYSTFDSDQNCLLTINELNEMIIPREPQIATTVKTKPPQGYKGMSPPTVDLLTTCLNKLFVLRQTIMRIKRNLSSQKVDLKSLFN